MYNGSEYDYVFDVELDEGGTRMKLPFNNGGSPISFTSYLGLYS